MQPEKCSKLSDIANRIFQPGENSLKFKLSYYYIPLSTKLNESRLKKGAEVSIEIAPKK